MGDTDKAWKKWGEVDPYFGVASVPEFRTVGIEKTRDLFFAEGESIVADRLDRAERRFGPIKRGSALDFGSGVGRLLIPLSRRFETVTGVDVSEHMHRECRSNLEQQGVTNATLVMSDDTLSSVTGTFDFVNSYVVLQHIPVPRGMALIERLLDVTAPGGIASLQLTVDRGDSRLQSAVYWMQRRLPGAHVIVNGLRGRPIRDPLAELNEYDLAAILLLFQRHDFGDVVVSLHRQGRVLSVDLTAQRNTADRHAPLSAPCDQASSGSVS